MRDVIILLVGLGVGACLQAVTGFLSDRRAHKREHETWLREQRLVAYMAFVDSNTAVQFATLNMSTEKVETVLLSMLSASDRAQLFADDRTEPAIKVVSNMLWKEAAKPGPHNFHDVHKATDELRTEMRKVLNIDPGTRS